MQSTFISSHFIQPFKSNHVSSICKQSRPRMAVATPPPSPSPSPSPSHFPLHASNSSQQIISIVSEETLSQSVLNCDSSLVVVMFHASWCRVCKTLMSKLPRVMSQFSNIKWYTVDFAVLQNKPLCAALDVKILPTFHFYKPGKQLHQARIDQFTAGPFAQKRLVERLQKVQNQMEEEGEM